MGFISGVDIGGTFTDCAVVDSAGKLFTGKAPTTPDDRARGFFDSLASAARAAGITPEDLLAGTDRLLHGTTVATNVVVERNGAKVGLITTRGHRDVILMMRGTGRTVGVPVEEMLDLAASNKPTPLIPRALIREVDERVDFAGDVILPLNEEHAREAIQSLIDEGVDAICVSFLWSFMHPEHEETVARLVTEIAPHVFVTAAHRLVSKWGEYERTVAGAINSYVGPVTKSYLKSVSSQLDERGYDRPFLIMQSTGGLAPVNEAEEAPLLTVGSGPVGGLEGVRFLAEILGIPNVIAADMGGTSFDVGLIVDGEPIKSTSTSIGHYQYNVPVVEVQSIGSGGGSVAWIDEGSGALRVGPRSAGASPGPAAYGRGGTEATVTDANVVLGYLNPSYLLGGAMPMDQEASARSVGELAGQLEMSLEEAASGVVTISEFQMADLVRRMTVQRGYDPRDFVMFAYGGAGPLHAAVIARELGIRQVIVPLGDAAGAWSALGVGASNVVRIFEHTQVTYEPFEPGALNAAFEALEEEARIDLQAQGFAESQTKLRRSASMQYGYQVHQVEVTVPAGKLESDDMGLLIDAFEARYARLYGEGSGFRQAGVQIIDVRVEAIGVTPKPILTKRDATGTAHLVTPTSNRDVYWTTEKRRLSTPVFRGKDVEPGQTLIGPVIIDQEFTTIVVHPNQTATVDGYGNIIIEIQQKERN